MLNPLLFSCLSGRCFLSRCIQVAMSPYRQLARKSGDDIEIPPEPTTCCMSGCANCVWVEYAEQLAKLLGDNDDRAREIVLSKITDPNLKMFLDLELRNLKQRRESNKTQGPEEPKKTS